MTKAQIQALIDNIDTTGNNGTTGQELKNIYEAFKNELPEYIETTITSNQLKNIDLVFPEILPNLLDNNKYYQVEEMILEYVNHSIDYDVTGIQAFAIRSDIGNANAFIFPNFMTFSGRKVAIIKFDAQNVANYNGSDITTYSFFPDLAFDSGVRLETYPNVAPTLGDGELFIKVWYKIKTFGSEL